MHSQYDPLDAIWKLLATSQAVQETVGGRDQLKQPLLLAELSGILSQRLLELR
jgi:hypothetical protein